MEKFLDVISREVQTAFERAGYDAALGNVTVSNRPDLCEYQCNGAMAAAKRYRKSPLLIAQEVAARLSDSPVFLEAFAAAPGFLNLRVSGSFLTAYLERMAGEEKFGLRQPEHVQTIVVDYGGPNVAKSLHVGHLRSAIIGESVKRICRYAGHRVYGDIHLGDWGLPIGMVIAWLGETQPQLPYFDSSYAGPYPDEPPFSIRDLEQIYPAASAKSKTDEEFKGKALDATRKFQDGVPGYRALWRHIMAVSIPDLKRNYDSLNVTFDLWKGESDVHERIPGMVEQFRDGGYLRESDGALVVDVKEETDTKEIPPCIILKSDGAALYATTDLATIQARMEELHPDMIVYLADKRQELHFLQVFRTAYKTGLVGPDTKLVHIGFGTMNGKDGKPFKTRDGGIMRLEDLVRDIREEMFRKILDSQQLDGENAEETAGIVALAAIKYGDLSNQASKDYIFDIDRFTSFEGDTGPYILYTIVRIKSILHKFEERDKESENNITNFKLRDPVSKTQKDLMMTLSQCNMVLESAAQELAPHRICAYVYELANAFNRFYHETKILTETERETKEGLIALLHLTRRVLETCIDLLGFEAPDRM